MAKKARKASRKRLNRVVPKSHVRFNVPVDLEQAREQFVNRSLNYVENILFPEAQEAGVSVREEILWQVANGLGKKWYRNAGWEYYVGKDFHKHLQGLELIYGALPTPQLRTLLDGSIVLMLSDSPIDLGIYWAEGRFWKKGAPLLDQELVNDPLGGLRQLQYESVRLPFEKGLQEFLKGDSDPASLVDAIRDVYEALEAMAKIVTGRKGKDLSANAELFLSKLRVSPQYREILKPLVQYANGFSPCCGTRSEPCHTDSG